MPKIVFMGTPDFAVPPLKALINAGFEIPLVVSQPDRKKGRGHKLQNTPVKEIALENNLKIFQPDSIRTRDAVNTLKAVEADYFIVIAYGKILPESILSLPHKACINVHASLLPKWRGAAPIQFSLLNGDEETGVCTMLMDKGMDTGDLLLTEKTPIDPKENSGQLAERLSVLGADLIVKTIQQFDGISAVKQDHEKATYTRLLNKEDRLVDWRQTAHSIFCRFRALSPFPGIVTSFRGKRLVIKEMETAKERFPDQDKNPGTITAINAESFDVVCGKGFARILACQPESKKKVNAQEFVNGHQVKIGEVLGDND